MKNGGRRGSMISVWMIRCGNADCQEVQVFDTTIDAARSALIRLGWRETLIRGWQCPKCNAVKR